MFPAVISNGSDRPPSRREKIRLIFDRFDANGDGALDRQEMADLVAAVNPAVSFTPDQISSVVDEVFRSYSDFIPNPSVGLSLAGLIQTYNDGAGDVDRDFAALFPNANRNLDAVQNPSPNHEEIGYESTWKAVKELELAIKARIRASRLNIVAKDSISFDGWSTDLGSEIDRARDGNSSEIRAFSKKLREIRLGIDQSSTTTEAFDGHMAIGRTLHDRKLFDEATESFRRAIELKPTDVRAHYQLGNSLTSLKRSPEAKDRYFAALKLAESDSIEWTNLLPQVHVNLGIAMETEGLLFNASEHYREAAILCPAHYRALKLLGSALFGIGDYSPAEKALEEAILLKSDFADAHCDLGSVLHSIGDDERAMLSFQKAIDLKPDHLDALYNLGGLFKDGGRYRRAGEMYARVLEIRPDHWRAQLNRAVCLLGSGEDQEAMKSLSEAFKMTNRVELYDALRHLKMLKRKPKEGDGVNWIVEDASKFKLVDKKTAERKLLIDALRIREIQKATKLGRCDVEIIKKEIEEIEARTSERSIRKSELELILRGLLHFLPPETFQCAMKAIDKKFWAVLDVTGSGKIDYKMFFAIISPICYGLPEKRKRAAFDALLCQASNQGVKVHVYLRYLRVVYFPSSGFTDLIGINGGGEDVNISFREFIDWFDDPNQGFGVMNLLVKLEAGDRARRCKYSCGVCKYRIGGLMLKEISSHFCLCASCYSECRVPFAFQKEEYKFKEYIVE